MIIFIFLEKLSQCGVSAEGEAIEHLCAAKLRIDFN